MSKEEILEIIQNEGLKINWFENHPQKEYEMVIREQNGKYEVYGTGERAAVWGVISEFDNMEEACLNLLRRSRAMKKLMTNRKK